MHEMKSLTKFKKLGELAPEASRGFMAFDEAASNAAENTCFSRHVRPWKRAVFKLRKEWVVTMKVRKQCHEPIQSPAVPWKLFIPKLRLSQALCSCFVVLQI